MRSNLGVGQQAIRQHVFKWLKLFAAVLSLAFVVLLVLGVYIKLSLSGPSHTAPEQGLVLDRVTVWNPGADLLHDQRLLIKRGEISTVEQVAADQSEGPYANHFVMPGLIDMHVHLLEGALNDLRNVSGVLNLYYGVTTVRDTGSTPEVFQLRADVAAGKVVGPRIFACGNALDGSKSFTPTSAVRALASAKEAVAEVQRQSELGADCIKILSGLEADTYGAVAQAAAKWKLPLVGHVPRSVAITNAKLDDVQHLFGIEEAAPNYADGELGGDKLEQVSTDRIGEVVAHSKQVGMAHTPTLIVYENVYNVHNIAERRQAGQEFLPRHYPNVIFHSDLRKSLPPAHRRRLTVRDADQHQRIYNLRLATVRALHDAGVNLHLGTDAPFGSLSVPGAALHTEIAAFRKAGIELDETLRLATAGSGKFLGLPGLGTIAEGSPADLLIFKRDPRPDWEFDGNLVAVVANGRLYRREQLKAYLDEYQAHYDGFMLRELLPAVLRMLFF